MNEVLGDASVPDLPKGQLAALAVEQTVQPPPWLEFADLFASGQLIPFLGAAASAYCAADQVGGAPPTVDELVRKLAGKASLRLNCELSGCRQSRFDLARLASYYQMCITPRHRLDELLTTEIANPAFMPNPLHHLLARVARRKPMLIITTNYDDLLEKAFDKPADGEGPVPYEVVVTPADELAYASEGEEETGPEHAGGVLHWVSNSGEPDFERVLGSELLFDLSKRSVIYKIHGSVPRGTSWSGGYLIAEEDYTRFLGRMERRGLVPDPIKNIIGKKKKGTGRSGAVPVFSLLFLGYGMRDWNLRVLLEELHVGRRASNVEMHYAFMRRPDPVDRSLLEKRQVRVYDCDLASFVQNLSQLIT
jgi:hypothetical protein